MSEPISPQKEPYEVNVRGGRTYYWCACGRSSNQPFCDGSHSNTEFEPVEFKPDRDRTVYFCGCKKTGSVPLCDGSHNAL